MTGKCIIDVESGCIICSIRNFSFSFSRWFRFSLFDREANQALARYGLPLLSPADCQVGWEDSGSIFLGFRYE